MGGYPIAALIGSMVGGAVAVILLSMLLEAAIFRRVFDDPVMGKGLTVITAWILASVVWGFNTARWNGFNPNGLWIYGVPAVFVLVWYVRRGFKLRDMQDELPIDSRDIGIAKTFD